MKHIVLSVAAAAALAVGTAQAEDASVFDINGKIGVTSEYIERGFTNDETAIVGGIELEVIGFYLGAQGATLEDLGSISTNDAYKVDYYGGFRFPISTETTIDLGAKLHTFLETPEEADFHEFYIGAEHDWGDVGINPIIGIKASYSPDYVGNSDDAMYYQLWGRVNTPADIYFGFNVGHTDLSGEAGLDDYTDFSVGGGYIFSTGIDLRISYNDTTIDEDDEITLPIAGGLDVANETWQVTLKYEF